MRVAWPLALLVGCYLPSTRVYREQRHGEVLYRQGEQLLPVTDATVLVETWQVSTPGGERFELVDVFVTRTDGEGRFMVPSKAKRMWVGLLPDLGPAFIQRHCVSGSGFRASIADPWAATANPPWQYQWPERHVLEPTAGMSANTTAIARQGRALDEAEPKTMRSNCFGPS
jgi:hypothetical protein